MAAAQAGVNRAIADEKLAEANSRVSIAKIGQVKALLSYDRIVAPFDGTIISRSVDPGDFVQSAAGKNGTKLLTLASDGVVRVFAEIPESDVPFVKVGTQVKVTPYDNPDNAIAGKVTRMAAALSPATRTMTVEIDLVNAKRLFTSGMYAAVNIFEPRTTQVLVPTASIITEGSNAYVYLVRNRRAIKVPIAVGYNDGVNAVINKGLASGDHVVVQGQAILQTGDAVDIVRHTGPPSPAKAPGSQGA